MFKIIMSSSFGCFLFGDYALLVGDWTLVFNGLDGRVKLSSPLLNAFLPAGVFFTWLYMTIFLRSCACILSKSSSTIVTHYYCTFSLFSNLLSMLNINLRLILVNNIFFLEISQPILSNY